MSDDTSTFGIRYDIVGTVVGIVVLSFLLGSSVTYFEVFPFKPYIEQGFVALKAQWEQNRNVQGGSSTGKPVGFSNEKRYDGKGVVKHVESEVSPGYTMFATGRGGAGAKLITPDGEVVHEWHCRHDDAYDSPSHIDDPVPSKNVVWRKTHLYPNGDVVVVYTARFNTDTPNGYGIIKVDRKSNLLWAHEDNAHHDVDVGPDGKIYTLTHGFRDVDEDPVLEDWELGSSKHGGKVMDDYVLVLSPEGERIKKFSILDAMKKGDFARKLEGKNYWDILHANNVDVLRNDFAEHHDFASPGDVVVSFRTVNAVAFLDVENERMTWMHSGSWKNQHDPDPLPNGEMWVYDNQGVTDDDSRIMRVQPASGAVLWTYGAADHVRFQSKVNGEQDPLENGNVLVTESKSGRLFEVTPDKEIVWDYRIEEQAKYKGKTYTPSFLGAKRYKKSYLDFDPREVEAGKSCE